MHAHAAGVRHEALLYAGDAEFLRETVSFVRAGIARDEPTLVVVDSRKIELLQAELDSDAGSVYFADMAEIGRNPARIIPAWRDFVSTYGADGNPLRGIGEPVWAGRGASELAECHRHESLLNLAFAEAPAWWLVCPYDVERLDPDVVERVYETHPFVRRGRERRQSSSYHGVEGAAAPFTEPLPEPPRQASGLLVEPGPLHELRAFVSTHAAAWGLEGDRRDDFVLAVHEVVTNSIRHGGGHGTLRIWRDGDAVVCEVADAGVIEDPLAGRVRPTLENSAGRGLWLANQLCDLVQQRQLPAGNVVRLHQRR